MRPPPFAIGLDRPTLHDVRTAAWLSAYALLALVSAELWSALAGAFDIYRPLDLDLGTAVGFVGLALVEYVVMREVSVAAEDWLRTSRSRGAWTMLIGLLITASFVYGITPTQLPGYSVAFVGLGALILQGILSISRVPAVGQLVARAFFGAFVVTMSLFWISSTASAGRHLTYAKALATPKDSLAERGIAQLALHFNLEAERSNPAAYWERCWREQPYLSSNYFFDFEPNLSGGYFGGVGELAPLTQVLEFDESHTPVYRVRTPHGHTVVLKLNREFRHSAYSAGLAYKGLERLARYHYLVFDAGEVTLTNASSFDLASLVTELPAVGEFGRLGDGTVDGAVYRQDEDTYVLIGESLPEVEVWTTLFAFALSVLLAVGAVLELAQRARHWRHAHSYWAQLPLQIKLPALLLGSTLTLFTVVALATFGFLAQNNAASTYERQLNLARSVRADLRPLLEAADSSTANGSQLISPPELRTLFERRLVDVDVYAASGSLLGTSFASQPNARASVQLAPELLSAFAKNPTAILVRTEQFGDLRHYVRTYFGLASRGNLRRIVALNTPIQEAGTAQDIPVIMGKLLVVYVGLLLLAWVCGMVLIRMLVGPLLVLADRMRSFQLGDVQEPLAWSGDDGVGRLIAAYNAMLGKLDASTKALVAREREGAWQVMAQQIAHEINNTLTPLRLNAEYLTMTLSRMVGIETEGPRRMAAGMIERIDYLSQVAAQFKSFAQLEAPKATAVTPSKLLREYTQHKQESLPVRLSFVDNPGARDAQTLIDVSHFTQVLNNLVGNAARAVGEQSGGQVALSLKRQENRLLLEVRDNGPGIPEDQRERLFDPTFSTQSSQTGLGLPISKRILEFYGAELTYTSRVGVGTSFYISMRVEGDAEPSKRIVHEEALFA